MADITPLMTRVVESLVTLVEQSDGKNWVQPWVNLGLGKQFRHNGELYRGTNQLWLGLIAVAQGLEAPHIWAGYSTWQELGYQVPKGQKSLYNPIYAAPIAKCSIHGKGNPGEPRCCEEQSRFMVSRVLKGVFHLSQVEPIEGETQTLPTLPKPPKADIAPHEIISRWKGQGMDIRMVDSDRAYFSPMDDYINLPPVGAFKDEIGFHATVLHEATHWTGHSSRLARANMNMFGTPDYAFEELVAEIGAAVLAAQLGYEASPEAGHGEYLASWLQVLKSEPMKLHEAAVLAEKAAQFLVELGEVKAEAA